MLTVERVPVRLDLESLPAEACIRYSQRFAHSALDNQPRQHPLMHQLGRNPDCVALAVTADRRPMALGFFHYRVRDACERRVALHTFMVHPHLRDRCVGTLLAIHLLRAWLQPLPERLILEVDCPVALSGAPLMARLFPELSEAGEVVRRGAELAALLHTVEQEERLRSPELLTDLIARPEFRVAFQRDKCMVGALSEDSRFFEWIAGCGLPEPAVVQPVLLGQERPADRALGDLDLLLIDESAYRRDPALPGRMAVGLPHVPVVLVGERPARDGSGLLHTPREKMAETLAPLVAPFQPVPEGGWGPVRLRNLLGLPESPSLSAFRRRHEGERLFIAASGPSLAEVDPALLAGETTLTINDALQRFPHSRYAAVMDARKLHELHRELLNVEAVFTLAGNSFGMELDYLGTEGFTTEIERGVYTGYTTSYFALQVAIYMGFREIYYLGLDLGNTAKQTHFFGNRPLQERDRPEVYAKMRRSFEGVVATLGKLGVGVFNCSPVSALKVFPFRDLRQVVGR